MSRINFTRLIPIVLVWGVVGFGILVYMWQELGERGLYADATGTSGYTTKTEIALVVGGLMMLISSAIFVLAVVTRKR